MTKRKALPGQLPLFQPRSSWTLPDVNNLPNLKHAMLLGVDTETCDPRLLEMGPGFCRGDAYACGVSLAVPDGPAIYLPIDHKNGKNLPREPVIRYLKDQLGSPGVKVGANLLYDVEVLDSLGIELKGPWIDVQVAQPLLDERFPGGFSLNNLAQKWLGLKKDEQLLNEAAASYNVDPKNGLWSLAPEYVGPYAEQDARLPLEIYLKQSKELGMQGLIKIFNLETSVLPIVWAMRKRGVRVDLGGSEQLRRLWLEEERELIAKIKTEAGLKPDIWSDSFLIALAESSYLKVPETEKGNPSFTNEWLLQQEAVVFHWIARARKLEKMRRDFIEYGIQKYQVNGRLHAQFHPLRRDDGGTVSGRFSSSNPNLQQIPIRDPEFGPALRSLFLPEEDEQWCGADYSSQEPRLTVHFAAMLRAEGIEKVVESYRQNPKTDLHQMAAELAGISRNDAKGINLGLTYGMGKQKLADQLGRSLDEAEILFRAYHHAFPFINEFTTMASTAAKKRGYIKTLLGRRRRFPNQEYTHKAGNAIIQGSAADQTKQAMVKLYDEHKLIPLLQVHDELAYSVSSAKQAKLIKYGMETAVKLQIPVVADVKLGKNWREAH